MQLSKFAAVLSLGLLALCAACGGSDSSSSNASITISSPAPAATVTMGTDLDKSVPISFSLANFTLKDPGTCGSTANCGHVHLLIDDRSCTPSGAYYNNFGSASPTVAHFAACPIPAGRHTVKLELHSDGHAAIQVNGVQVESTVTFTTN